jgi:antitoxin CcdA
MINMEIAIMALKDHATKRRPINLTIRADILREAKALGLNSSQAAEAGLVAAIKKAREHAWLKENAKALHAHNERIDKTGPLITPAWSRD